MNILFKSKNLNKYKNIYLINKLNSTNGTATGSRNPPGIDLKTFKSRTTEDRNNNEEKKDNSSNNKYAAIALLSIPISTFFLGCWQVKRREWKIEKIKLLHLRVNAAKTNLPLNLSEIIDNKECEYKPYTVKGKFDHKNEILLTIRQDVTGKSTKPGAYVITPFELSDRKNVRILVNRGFIPFNEYSSKTRFNPYFEGERELTGLYRLNETSGMFTPDNFPLKSVWHCRIIQEMAACLDTQPIFLDEVSNEKNSQNGGPTGGQTIIQLRNEHLTYIVTWFTLSALTSVMWYKRFFRYFYK